jgi:hypothetical protein
MTGRMARKTNEGKDFGQTGHPQGKLKSGVDKSAMVRT